MVGVSFDLVHVLGFFIWFIALFAFGFDFVLLFCFVCLVVFF